MTVSLPTSTRRLAIAGSLAALALTWAVSASAGLGPVARFRIAPGPLDAALLAYAAQSGDQLLYSADQVAGLRTQGLSGVMPTSAALERLLAGSGLAAIPSGPHVLVLQSRLRRGDDGVVPSAATGPPPAPIVVRRHGPQTEAGPTAVDELVVTGSLIRGALNRISPLAELDRTALDQGPQATVVEALGALPQTFAGEATVNTSALLADPRATNDIAASGVSLRGLGAQSTLVLVDGVRMAGAGVRGDFADVSQIPTIAVARVNVLLDGASASYGADAIGGVVDMDLRGPFDGAESRLRASVLTEGGGASIVLGEIFGTTRANGGAVFAYELEHQDALKAEDRAATRSSDLRALGGSDHRLIFSHPGNVLQFDASTGTYTPIYAIPTGQDGAHLTPAAFEAGRVNLNNMRAGTNLYPRQDRESFYLRLEREAAPGLKVSTDLRFSRRTFSLARTAALTVLQVGPANPFFVSPAAAGALRIGYSFGDEVGPMQTKGSAQSFAGSVRASQDLPWGWRLDLIGAHATETGRRRVTRQINSLFLNEALGGVPDNPSTRYVASRDGYFNPFGDSGANAPSVLAFVTSGYTRALNASAVDTFDLKIDGTLAELPSGPLRLALGAQMRRERFQAHLETLLTQATPKVTALGPFDRKIEAAFFEVRIPVLPQVGGPAAPRLELSVAGRLERYEDVGQTANPKFGVRWEPADGLALRATFGTSFRAPNLLELNGPRAISSALIPSSTGQTAVIVLSGANPALRPEHARSWTFGVDLAPRAAPRLRISATWFSTALSGEIGAPVLADNINALLNPAYSLFVRRVNSADPADLAYVNGLIATLDASVALPASSVGAVVDARSVNAGRVRVEGGDASISYSAELGDDTWRLSAQATYLYRFDRQMTPTAPRANLVDTAGHPIALRGRASLTWGRGALGVTAAVHHAGAYRTEAGQGIGAFTTGDLQLRWAPIAGPARGLDLSLSVLNLLDRSAPFYDNPLGFGFDPANADPKGRSISVQMLRRW